MKLAIKSNNSATNDPCAICHQRTDPRIGPEMFLANEWDVVCHQCAKEHDPVLFAMLTAYLALEGAYHPTWCERENEVF